MKKAPAKINEAMDRVIKTANIVIPYPASSIG